MPWKGPGVSIFKDTSAVQYCTAWVALKMETPGPFQGTRQNVLDYIKEFY